MENGCPPSYETNEHGQCIRIITYAPVEKICPDDFELHYDMRTQVRTCRKKSWVNPLYTIENLQDSTVAMSCKQDVFGNCELPSEVRCPTGHRLILNPPEYVRNSMIGRKQLNQKFPNALCFGHIILPPDSTKKCIKTYRWSNKLASCMKLLVLKPSQQCPRPDIHIGYGKGDRKTPFFQYEEDCQCCVATEIPALHPQCNPGWALEGLTSSVCVRKQYFPIVYDCHNAPGFSLRWDQDKKVGICEKEIVMTFYTPGWNYLTRRTKIESNFLQSGSYPWTVQKAFWDTEEMQKNQKKEGEAFVELEPEDINLNVLVSKVNFSANNFTKEEFAYVKQNSAAQNIPIDYDQNEKKKKEITQAFETISIDLIPTSEPDLDDERLERSIAWKTSDAFHSELPYTRQDLLNPRSPGSFSASPASHMSHQSKLHVYSSKRGIF
ncbi:uncharacterized protein LOC128884018 isoform X2 [Hylaeus volcanicus]|nr:uncharacterized protein LOC128884018 isoform X2 [Hylaeus volcanicus]